MVVVDSTFGAPDGGTGAVAEPVLTTHFGAGPDEPGGGPDEPDADEPDKPDEPEADPDDPDEPGAPDVDPDTTPPAGPPADRAASHMQDVLVTVPPPDEGVPTADVPAWTRGTFDAVHSGGVMHGGVFPVPMLLSASVASTVPSAAVAVNVPSGTVVSADAGSWTARATHPPVGAAWSVLAAVVSVTLATDPPVWLTTLRIGCGSPAPTTEAAMGSSAAVVGAAHSMPPPMPAT